MFKRNKSSKPILVAAASDMHTNSTVGVNPLHVDLGDDGEWRAGESGKWQHACWTAYWDIVWNVKKEVRADLYVVVDGDAADDPYHPTTKVVTQKKDVIVRSAAKALARPREMADEFFMVGGTDAHGGIDHWIEELIAESLEATPDEVVGKFCWSHLTLMAGGVKFDVCHHPETAGYRPWTEHSATVRQSEIIQDRYVEMGEQVPDEAIRGHVHYFSTSGEPYKPRVVYLPPWQLTHKTTYGKRRGGSYYVRPIGGVWYQCKDGKALFDYKLFRGKARDAWQR